MNLDILVSGYATSIVYMVVCLVRHGVATECNWDDDYLDRTPASRPNQPPPAHARPRSRNHPAPRPPRRTDAHRQNRGTTRPDRSDIFRRAA